MAERIPELPLEPPAPKPMPVCPVCGDETDTYYKDFHGTIVGCDQCMDTVDAREVSA